MVKGTLFTGEKNSVFEKAKKSYLKGSLPKLMEKR